MQAIKYRRLSAAVSGALLLAALPAAVSAQDTGAEATRLDRVEVTGSRIKKAEVEGQTPIQVIDREQIDKSGLNSIADVLQQITGSGSALNTKFNSSGNFGFPPDGGGVGAGSASVDLRHLGAKRVLVLVDGIRWINESSASGVGGVVDLNTIPLAIVERIEVLEDGASSLYGSDAIAGVVNIITRRNFEGVELRTSYGQYEGGDGETTSAEITLGGMSDRLSYVFSVSYNQQDPIFSRTREQSAFPRPGTGVALGSGGIPAGRFLFTDPRTGARMDLVPNAGVTNPVYDPNQTGCTRTDGFHCFTSADRFNFSVFNLLLTPNERRSVFGQTRFDVNESTSWYVKALYNNRQSTNQAAPEPIFLGPGATGNAYSDNIVVSASNPFNPFGIDLRATGPGANLITIGRRPLEGGARVFNQDVDTFYLASGLEGSFDVGARSFFWDVNAVYSDNDAEQVNFGSYNIRRIALALGPLSACQADPRCVPLNIFGANTITPQMLAYIQPVVRDSSSNKLQLYSANISGDLFELPAGMLAFAGGYEFRKYKGSYRPDALTVAGEYNGVPSLPTTGSYDVNEFYLELGVPLVSGVTGIEQLDLSIAGRYSDYSTFGGETTAKAGLRWQVNDQFLLRGTWSEGFRAPTIGELFGSQSRFDAQINDPCLISINGNPPTAPRSNCAALGVPVGAQQINGQISVLTGGNANLKPEMVDSYSAGLVWSPEFAVNTRFAERLDFELTWYKHELEGGIQALDAQTQLNLCASTLNPLYCNGISRASTGVISRFENFLVNLGQIETSGYDIDVFWTLPETGWGKYRVSWRNTFVDDYVAIGAGGTVQPQSVGIEVNNSAIPEWTSNLAVDWTMNDWDANWTMRHISDLTERCGTTVAFPVCRDQARGLNFLGSTTYHDLQVGVKTEWLGGTRFSLGVNNVFSKEPPICLSCSLNGYDASTYDMPESRFWYLRAEIKL